VVPLSPKEQTQGVAARGLAAGGPWREASSLVAGVIGFSSPRLLELLAVHPEAPCRRAASYLPQG